jgi:hypothetical protein
MKRIILASIAALALTAPALSQTSTTVTTESAGAAVTIAPEQRMKIKQYVTTSKPKSITMKEKVTVGATLPADVELQAVPSDWGPSVSRYRYVYTGDDVVLVEPSSRKVIQVID